MAGATVSGRLAIGGAQHRAVGRLKVHPAPAVAAARQAAGERGRPAAVGMMQEVAAHHLPRHPAAQLAAGIEAWVPTVGRGWAPALASFTVALQTRRVRLPGARPGARC
jgi:hypothetical protein